jgi:hypothetical protein
MERSGLLELLPHSSLYARSFRQRFLLIVARRTERVIARFTNLRPTGSAAAYLAFFILAPLRSRVSSDSNAEVDAVRVLSASLPINIILAFLLGYQAYRGFLFWAVFALFNGILSCCGEGLARSILP